MVMILGPKSFHNSLVTCGFTRMKEGVYIDSCEVRSICSSGISRKNGLASISLGLWVFSLSADLPENFNSCHIYGSLGAVFPDFAHLEIFKGKPSDESWQELLIHSERISKNVFDILSESSLKRLFQSGHLERCFIRKEARSFLNN